MENIVKSIQIPDNMTQIGHSHCKEYLDKAMDHMIKLGDTWGAISSQHPLHLNTPYVQVAHGKQEHLITQFRALTLALWEKAPPLPMHSTMNTSASGQSVLADTYSTEAKKLKEASIQATDST